MFDRLKKKLLYPNNTMLIISAFISIPFLTLLLWRFSFSWWTPFLSYLVLLLVILILIAFRFKSIDKKNKTRLFTYSIIWIISTIVLGSLSYPTRDLLISRTEIKGQIIINKIEQCKILNGEYPLNLENDCFGDISKWTYIGTYFRYNKYKDQEDYSLRYNSFRGYHGIYDNENKKWIYYD